ncbi:SRPBCC family protein [Streptomyces sp. NPDC007971]|uniref:SRPBCC family protein n=1 Tax=Streptomyces sp. NPDC007971 TaxID=3364799 RepID=UPI0036E03624
MIRAAAGRCRTKKARVAFAAATYLAGRRFGLEPQQLLAEGIERLRELPQFADLNEQLRGEVLDAGRKAMSAVADRKEVLGSGEEDHRKEDHCPEDGAEKAGDKLGEITEGLTGVVENGGVLPKAGLRMLQGDSPKFSSFTKGVRSVSKGKDTESDWKVKVGPSTRGWKATVQEQVPDERIAWTSEGAKGTTRGCVSFHELTPTLTRIVLVVEYYPSGLFEKTGNIWRAQGRRLRLDFKHFQRYVTLTDEEPEGWRGEIRDGKVVRTHEEAIEEEEEEAEDTSADDEYTDEEETEDYPEEEEEEDEEGEYDEEEDEEAEEDEGEEARR